MAKPESRKSENRKAENRKVGNPESRKIGKSESQIGKVGNPEIRKSGKSGTVLHSKRRIIVMHIAQRFQRLKTLAQLFDPANSGHGFALTSLEIRENQPGDNLFGPDLRHNLSDLLIVSSCVHA